MDGRTSRWLILAGLLVSSTGCMTTATGQANQAALTNMNAKKAFEELAGNPNSRRSGDKKLPSADLAVAWGKLKEQGADAAKQNPDQQMRQLDDARRSYLDACTADANHIEAWRGLARVYVAMGDYERGFETYRKATAKHPANLPLWQDWGMAHNRRKDFAEAAKCFQKALEIDPENREVQRTLGYTLARAGQIEQSLAHLTRALGSSAAHYNVARMCMHLQQRDQALIHLRLSVRENPNYEDARTLLAQLESGTGDGANPPSGIVNVGFQATVGQ